MAFAEISPPAGAPPGGDASAGGAAINPGLPVPAPIAGLRAHKARRRALRAESERLGIASRGLDAAEEARRAAVAACDALVAGDAAATLAWASSGSPGDPPRPDQGQHDKLAAALARAEQSVSAAKAICVGIGDRQVQIAAELRVVDARINEAALDELALAHARAVAAASKAILGAGTLIAEANSFRQFLLTKARNVQTAGDHDAGIMIYRRAEKLGSPAPMMGVGEARTAVMLKNWALRYSEMVADD